LFYIPESLTPADPLESEEKTLSLVLDNTKLAEITVRVSRYSLCGEISDFKIAG